MRGDPSFEQQSKFGPFRLELGTRTLTKFGHLIPLRARTFDLLAALIDARGELVTKEDLMTQVWGGRIVEENTIQAQVSSLRKALGEDVEGRRYIVTEPGRGYRFVAGQPSHYEAAASSFDAELSKEGRPSVVVMPFQNMSGDPAQDYFADGIVEEIVTALSRLRWLLVIAGKPRPGMKSDSLDVKQIGRELGATYVLLGSVRKAEDQIRISAQLVATHTGVHIWADRFDGALVKIFDLQADVAARVVGAIAPKVEDAEIKRASRKPTGNLDAYDLYLRGLALFHRETRESNDEALRCFNRAIELDPDFASAYGMAAWCYSQRHRDGWVTSRVDEKAETKRLALRAAELGRDDAIALCMAGNALAWVAHEVELGATFIERAIELNPSLPMGWDCSAWVKVWLGDADSAIEHATRAMRLSPMHQRLHAVEAAIGFAHFIAGRYDLASSWAERAFHKKRTYQGSIRILAASYAQLGQLERARAVMQCMRDLNPHLRIRDLAELVPLRRADDFIRYADGLRQAGLPE